MLMQNSSKKAFILLFNKHSFGIEKIIHNKDTILAYQELKFSNKLIIS